VARLHLPDKSTPKQGCTGAGVRVHRRPHYGYTGTIFASGQTGSGKTHTMMGPHGKDGTPSATDAGIIPRTVVADGYRRPGHCVFSQGVLCRDLRGAHPRSVGSDGGRPPTSRGPVTKKFFVRYVKEVYALNAQTVLDVLAEGGKNRAVGKTSMNNESSRSHSILQLTVSQVEGTTTKAGKLYLVDLAGSERASRSEAEGKRLNEAKYINKSLSALGNVINALTKRQPHIPYRDSKLSLLPKDIGGNSRTVLVICCATDKKNVPETPSTLRFGERAKLIRNHARINVEVTAEELKVRLSQTERENSHLKVLLSAHGGVVPSLPGRTEEEWQKLVAALMKSEANAYRFQDKE